MAEETSGAVWANQFDNTANRLAHIKTTAPEIWAQTGGRVNGFICAAGTGGTIAGVGLGLKEFSEDVVIGLADPHGASLFSWYKHGELRAEGNSVSEGIGQSRITANLDGAPIDDAWRISDHEALPVVHDLMQHEGLCVGLSSGINVAGAMRLAENLGQGKTVVTVLCDSGLRYLSSIFNRDWLRARDLPVPEWLAA
jgi:cysteine synthase A